MMSYKPLFVLLLHKGITKTQLRELVGFSTATLAKMSKNEHISMKTIEDICACLDCRVENVIEFIPDNK
jgi:DNA-binding Xre family transcriptional regulator